MKRILALILAFSMLGGTMAIASDIPDRIMASVSSQTEEVEEINEMPAEYIADKTVVEGTVQSVEEGQIVIEELALNTDDNTLVCGTDLFPTEIKTGDHVRAIVSTMTTRSIPPQAYAYYVIVCNNPEELVPIYMTVEEVKDGFIYSEDGNYEISYENSEVSMYRTKNIVKAEELTKGSEIFVYADVMTMSIPALVNPSKIIIKSIATEIETSEETEATEDIEAISDKRIVEGTVKGVTEDQIALGELTLNIDENTRVLDTNLIPTQVKEGDLVTAVASTMTTFSIPAQSYAYYVIVRPNAETAAPIYMTVGSVKDGVIASEDGNYEVTFENAEVSMYRTKNIVKAEELTKGSEIFVYADVMTMSIPALVNPTKIVIMSIAEVNKADELNRQGVLVGNANGLELDREVTRAEAVALVFRTTASAKRVYVSNFEDVAKNYWAYDYISWAFESGIVNGVGEGKFEPERTVTANELAMMILNAMGEKVEFENAFETASEMGIIAFEDGIEKEDTLTRDATAKIIYNYINR